jgi:hypothetical protein
LLAAKKFDPDSVREYADEFLAQDRFGDAFEFYRKLDDRDGILKVKKSAIEVGDPEVLWRIEHYNSALVSREEWLQCGEQAMKMGKHRSAAYVFRRTGEAERLAEAEKEFKPAAAAPQSPEGQRPA